MQQMTSDRAVTPGPDPGPPRRMGWFRRLLSDLMFVVVRDRKWWAVPLLMVLLLLAALLFVAAAAGPLAPFIYPLL
jgi:uncharacterized protein DUF5989